MLNMFLVLPASFLEEIDRHYPQLTVVRPLGCSGCCTVTCIYVCTGFWGRLKWSCRGMISVKWGEMMVTRGSCTYLIHLRGHTQPMCGQKGGSLRPLARSGSISLNNGLDKNEQKVWVLGKGCRHLGSASELILGQFGARGCASRGRVLPIPPFDHKSRGIPPFGHVPTFS